MLERMRTLARKHLGGTALWRYLLKARFHLLKGGAAALRAARRVFNALSWRLRRLIFRCLPRRAVYRLLQSQIFYGERYFDARKDPLKESGYGDVYSDLEEFHVVAELSSELLGSGRALDVGCAKGFQVLALKEMGLDAWGVDISEYAVRTAPPEISGKLKVGGCREMDFPDAYFDLVLAMEVLEHIPPTDIVEVVEELRRLSSRWVWATIPSYGPNRFGPDGVVGGKILERYVHLYREDAVDFADFRHLTRDINALPIHGHLITATFDWWTSVFTQHGFIRRGDRERVINDRLKPAREGLWNSYVFEKVEGPGDRPLETGQLELALERNGDASWRSSAFHLPRGIHHVEMSLESRTPKRKRGANRRMVAVECSSHGGERINSLFLLGERELRKALRRRSASLAFGLPSSGEGDLVLSISADPGIEASPHPVRIETGAAAE